MNFNNEELRGVGEDGGRWREESCLTFDVFLSADT